MATPQTARMMRMTAMFFDRRAVTSRVDAATRRVLSKMGAYVMTDARQSLKKRTGPSTPPAPPHSHTGLVKRFLFFKYDPNRRSVVVGPELLPGLRADNLRMLEFGGTRTVTRRGRRPGRQRYRARPFMRPALHKNLAKFPGLWRDAI